MNPNLIPQDQVFWYLKKEAIKQLKHNIKTDVVVIGGGMAGLSAAQSFYQRGCKVVLIEKNYCGAGASGKSSGFITPDSELDLTHFVKLYGLSEAKKIWDLVLFGCDFIKKNIFDFQINCNYVPEDTLIVANSGNSTKELIEENNNRKKLFYESNYYKKNELQKIIGSNKYFGGLCYSNTFGIDAYLYCQAMQANLEKLGVSVFEETPAIKVDKQIVQTPYGSIEAKYIIICVDRFLPELDKLKKDVFFAQTFLMMSEPLTDNEVRKIFPERNLMVWDTDLIYQYYRINSDNRFMLGGSDLLSIFWGKEEHNLIRIFKKLTAYMKDKFPDVKVNFKYYWPGLIGVSKDIMPIAGVDETNPNIYYVSAAAGLPWASALGWLSAQRIIDNKTDFEKYFTPYRKYPINHSIQTLLGKRLTFAISNLSELFL